MKMKIFAIMFTILFILFCASIEVCAKDYGNIRGKGTLDVLGATSMTLTLSQGGGNAGGSSASALSGGDAGGNTSHADSTGDAGGLGAHADSAATADGNSSHADSQGTATGTGAHADSNGHADGNASHAAAGGETDGLFASAHGPNTNADGASAHALGQYINALFDYSVAIGSGLVGNYLETSEAHELVLGSQGVEAIQVHSDEVIVGVPLGVGTAPTSGTLHVKTGASISKVDGGADDLVIENSTNAGISILTPNGDRSQIYFGSPEDSVAAIIRWDSDQETSGALTIATANNGAILRFGSGTGAEAMRVDAAGLVTLSSGAGIDEFSTTSLGTSNTKVPTEGAIKAYVDAAVGGAVTLDIDADTGTPGTVLVGTETFTLNGTTNEIETAVALQDITIGLPNAVTISGIMTAGTHTAGAGGVNSSGDITATASDLYISGITSILGDWITGGDIDCTYLTADRWNTDAPSDDTWIDLDTSDYALRVNDNIVIQYQDTTQNILSLGTIGAEDIDIKLNNNSVFVQGSNGFVGIRNAIPGAELDVIGDIDASGQVTSEDAYFTDDLIVGDQLAVSGISLLSGTVTTNDINANGDVHIGGTTGALEALVVGDLNENINTGTVFIAGNTTGNSHFMIGQDATHGLTGTWDYEAVSANAEAYLNTFGYSNKLHINASTLCLQDGGGTAEGVGIGLINPAYEFDIYTTNTTFAMNIFNDGNSTNNAGIRVQCGEDTPSGATIILQVVDGNGTNDGGVQNNGGTIEFFQESDRKLKDGITTSTRDGLNIITRARVVDYGWEGRPGRHTGFVAQELETVLPSAVTTHSYSQKASAEDRFRDGYTTRSEIVWTDIPTGTTKTITLDDGTTATRAVTVATASNHVVHSIETQTMVIAPTRLIPVLVQAVQQQQKQIKNLRTDKNQLQNTVAQLLARMTALEARVTAIEPRGE